MNILFRKGNKVKVICLDQVPRIGESIGCFNDEFISKVDTVVWLPNKEYLDLHFEIPFMTKIDVVVWCK